MGLLDDFGEYLRRSGRNLGMGADAALANAQDNNARKDKSVEATLLQMQGADLTPEQRDALHNPPYGGFGTDAGVPGGGLLGTYVGVKSATANRQMLGKAKAAIERGMDPETARQKFGWFQDPTGDWKSEISDHRAQLLTDETGRYKLEHPELRRAYPDLVDTLQIGEIPGTDSLGRSNPMVANYTPSSNTANLNHGAIANREEALQSLMHELQHGVQFKEGHSPGTTSYSTEVTSLANTEYDVARNAVTKAIDDIRSERQRWFDKPENRAKSIEDYDKAFPDWDARYRQAISTANRFPDVGEWMHHKYESALGEVEARDTQKRLRLTPDQRRQTPPYKANEVPGYPTWDMRAVTRRLQRKVADDPQGLLTPEQGGMALSLLGLPFLPSDAE
jgi:hypothetical protein